MRLLLPLFVAAGLLSTQVFAREAFELSAWTPDLLTPLLLWLGVSRPGLSGPLIAALLGAAVDAVSGSPLGFHILHHLVLYAVVFSLGARVKFGGLLGYTLEGVFGALLSLLILALISRALIQNPQLSPRLGALLLPKLVIVTLTTPLIVPLLDQIDGLLKRRPDGDLLP
ncbi:hypothetical protein KKF91_11140 [Myxococcota bacterium]|nr:hypothetical protein [Myxococcota bacterium]MBU1431083.1 hypothetical protein [Myxococcota bacterium]MBU1896527.1 hypothetical protein [Myxococcota bacterium]